MGSPISRIEREFILGALDEKKIPVTIHGDRKDGSAVILSTRPEEWIELFSPEKDLERFEPEENLRIFFSYYGHVMTFHSRVLHSGETLKVSYPDGIHKNLQRKYERVPPPVDCSLSFTVKETRVEMQFPKTEEYDPVDEPEIHGAFDTQDLNQLITTFREEASGFADSTQIVMFRGKDPENLEQRIVARTGKILYLPRMSQGLPRESSSGDSRLLTESYLFPSGRSGEILKELSVEALRDYFKERAVSGADSAICCPILYQQYVVGGIFLETRRDGKPPLDQEALEYVFQFGKILAYSLKVNGYFNKSREVMSQYSTGIVDISASGLLFANPSPALSQALTLYSDLEVLLSLQTREMKIGVRLMRKYSGKNTTYYGLQFLDIRPEDFQFLFDFVYGKSYHEHDDTLWEGGAEPPTLTFD